MANTYTLIASNTVGSGGAASVDFTSIPATYTDLLIKVSARKVQSGGAVNLQMLLNTATTAYTQKTLLGNGSAAYSFSDSTELSFMYVTSAADTANTFNNTEIYIPNYAGANYKSISIDSVTETNAAATNMTLMAGLWSSTSAINQITLKVYSPNTFIQYSSFYLYGIKNS
jgi:hypothetical protein